MLIFIVGLIIGSFLNAVIYRLAKSESMIKKRSHCLKCGHVLAWYELVPVISFVIQRRRCRACSALISWQYPIVELATGAICLLILKFFSPFEFLNLVYLAYLMAVASLLIVIFVYDLKHYIVPDEIIYPAILVSSIWYLVSSIFFNLYTKYYLLNTFYSACGAAVVFATIFFISKGRWLGFGDVKLVFFMGLFLGWPNILAALFFAFMLGGIIGIGLIALGKKTLKSQVPFGPFLVAGTFVAMFWGRGIINWYLNLFI